MLKKVTDEWVKETLGDFGVNMTVGTAISISDSGILQC